MLRRFGVLYRKCTLMLMAQIEDAVHDLRQDEKDLMVYVAELQRLWSNLDHCDPLELPHSECVVTLNNMWNAAV